MPQSRSNSHVSSWSGVGWTDRVEGVKVVDAVTSQDGFPRLDILHRKTKWVKFNGDIIIGGKTTDGD